MSQALSELDRRVANILRVGTVIELDAANARVKVDMGDLPSEWLPWGTGRAGTTRSWSAPSVGEQVMVFAPSGELADAVVGPSIFQDLHPAPASSGDQEHIVFPDGTTVDYNSASNTLTVTVAGSGNVVINCKNATVNADTGVTLNTPETTCTGNLTVAKNFTMGGTGSKATITGDVEIIGSSLTHNGKNVGSTHTHGGIQPGGSSTAVPN